MWEFGIFSVAGRARLLSEELCMPVCPQLQKVECFVTIRFTYYSACLEMFTLGSWKGGSDLFSNFRFKNNNAFTQADEDVLGRWRNENCTERKPFICYDDKVILIRENMNWSKALNHCRTHHHDLVTISNMDDQRWIPEKVKEASTDYVWLGLRFNCTLKFWFWVCPGTTALNVSDGATDDCNISGCMDVRGQHRWFDKNATEKLNFICAKV